VPPCLNIQPVLTRQAADPSSGTSEDIIISSDNTTVLGADDKSGLAPILEAVFYALEHDLPRPPLRLVFTTEEETGLLGAKGLADTELKDADFAVTFDHTGEQGVIIHQAPTYIQFEIECLGVSSHAGMQPEKGVSAAILAAKVINRLHLGRLDAETTANIGTIHGGKADNVVPDRVVITGELRGHNRQRIEVEMAYIENVLAEESAAMPGSQCQWTHLVQFEGYAIPEDHPGISRVAHAARQIGLESKLIRTNGGSDNNVFVQRGLPGIVLSAGYVDPHALTENVSLIDMSVCTRFLLKIFEQFTL
jgi:tripeptide aminopeptidase